MEAPAEDLARALVRNSAQAAVARALVQLALRFLAVPQVVLAVTQVVLAVTQVVLAGAKAGLLWAGGCPPATTCRCAE